MTEYSLYPAFVKFYYAISGIQHIATWPVKPGNGWVVGDAPEFENKAGGSTPIATAFTALMPLLQPLFATLTDFQRAEVWRYPDEESDPEWVYTHTIGVVGTGAATALLMGQIVLSFRTQAGHNFRLYLMEPTSTTTLNTRVSYPFGAGNVTNLTGYLTGANGWIFGRDGGALAVPIWQTSKYNDALRKKRLNM